MADFRFDIKPLFRQPIVKVTSNLLPHTFRGDRRSALDATSKMSEIIDRLGQLSAVSQKLSKPVTTAQRLRMSDNQIIYLMADVNAGSNGAVLGLLKVGTKDLYLFDENGQMHKVDKTPCILDFYIHESRQRTGLGKELFETMLTDEKWTPIKCSVDRPSEKLLGFLKKHYGLSHTIPQTNNFVLYTGFFETSEGNGNANGRGRMGVKQANGSGMHITNSPNTQLFGATFLGEDANKKRLRQNDTPKIGVQITHGAPAGRYGARRPTCSMAEARKNPLDALSRMSLRHQTIEKRSGLQDVDDEYFKKNVFSRPNFPRHSGLNDGVGTRSMMQVQNLSAAGQPSLLATESFMGQAAADGGAGSGTPSQQQGPAQGQGQPQGQGQGQGQQQAQAQQQAQGQQQAQAQGHGHQQQQQMQQGHAHGHGQPHQMQGKAQSHIIHNNSKPANGGAEASSNPAAEHDANNGQTATEAGRNDVDDVVGLNDDMQQLLAVAQVKPQQQQQRHEEQHPMPLEREHHFKSMPATAAGGAIDAPDVGHNGSPTRDGKAKSPLSSFQLSKQHTGMKNMSYGVGMAVTPSSKMEFNQEAREDFGIVKINRQITKLDSPGDGADDADAASVVSSTGEGLTDQGYYDLKFYHNKLW